MKSENLSLWGGPECTIVRIGDKWRSQLEETGHIDRLDDLTDMVELGITTVRYPVLWEQIASDNPDIYDFRWSDERFEKLRDLGVEVVAGLLHHGSGPRYTSLVDSDFPEKFASYAAKVAERYPWIEKWTPINEPLTTARFSTLYGHWYPHTQNFPSFARALVNQCLGTLRAMEAIRAVNPVAQLVQTEDMGKTFSTPKLRPQADYENHRRWLSFDLLCGQVVTGHPFYKKLLKAGISEAELDLLASGKAKPDMLGINHYLTSERYLDHRTELYPEHAVGSNGKDIYIDAEAVRVRHLDGKLGLRCRLKEVWQRYAIPIAVTEVHHGCSRDEQVRWLHEIWDQALQSRAEGVDVRAITIWSLFGAMDWRSLLTRRENLYDVGAFDMRRNSGQATLIAQSVRSLATTGNFDHPVLDTLGWWKRNDRLYAWQKPVDQKPTDVRKLWITGATGTLGQALARICKHRGLAYELTSREQCDIADFASVQAAIQAIKPWAVINASGYVRVADAEQDIEACMRANTNGAKRLAEACVRADIPLVTFSSDLVFDGAAGPYGEDALPCPSTVYGRSKMLAEQAVQEISQRHLIIRTSAFFGPWDKYNFGYTTASSLAAGQIIRACDKTIISPTFVPDLCHATLDLLLDGVTGVCHVTNDGQFSWYDLAQEIARAAGFDGSLVVPSPGIFPSNTALLCNRFTPLRPFNEVLIDWMDDMRTDELLGLKLSVAAE